MVAGRNMGGSSFGQGKVRSRRYRNRRLGEFLKELELTEGRATGIPTILKELKANGSPPPRFYFDDDRTLFEVELFIHPAFVEQTPIKVELEKVEWNLQGIDALLELLLEKTAGDIVGDVAEHTEEFDNQAIEIVGAIDRDIAGDIAEGITEGITEKMRLALTSAVHQRERKEIMAAIGLVNNVKNFNTYIAPLVAINWLTMTIPHKPTSPNQQYLTTLKGQLVLEFLKRNKQ